VQVIDDVCKTGLCEDLRRISHNDEYGSGYHPQN
jgi:hypothetical protein